jgi:gliding motility-associated-like protein
MKFDTLSVKIRDPNPTARFIIMDSSKTVEKYSFCYPNSVFLKSKSTYYDYLEWKKDNNSLFVNVDSFYQIFPALGKTKYELFIYDSVCARGSTVQKILTLSKPFPTYPNNVSVCQNNPISVGVTGDPAFRYFWQPTELFANPNAPSQTFVPKQNGRIDITVTDTIGCTDKGFFNYSVIGTEDPIQEKEFTLCLRKEKYLDIFSLPMLSYFWQPSGYAGNPLRVTEEGTYYFKGTDANGCQVKDTVNVLEFCPPQLHVPTAFSPNGDGLNDFFQVFGNDILAFDIKIFNRWGELIYHSNDFNFQWNGQYKGETVPIETYPFIISYKGAKYKDQELNKTFSGDVTVVR